MLMWQSILFYNRGKYSAAKKLHDVKTIFFVKTTNFVSNRGQRTPSLLSAVQQLLKLFTMKSAMAKLQFLSIGGLTERWQNNILKLNGRAWFRLSVQYMFLSCCQAFGDDNNNIFVSAKYVHRYRALYKSDVKTSVRKLIMISRSYPIQVYLLL